MNDDSRARIANATVQIPTKGGQGVLVPDGFILTAAHCINWTSEGGMILGDWFIEKVKTAAGMELLMLPCCVEPVRDIAVLAAPDGQEFYDEWIAVEEFVEATPPVLVSVEDHGFLEWFPVFILSHQGKWICGEAAQSFAQGQSPSLCVKAQDHIRGGTSGGPIVNDRGELVGIVSHSGGPADPDADQGFASKEGGCPRPHLTLPVWIWEAVARASRETKA
jgi:hypothetical protein